MLTQSDNSGTITYTNDDAGQLTGDGTNSYAYDDAGNRVGGSYGVTLGNQMTADANWTYSYDQKGNLTAKDSISTSEHWTYGYDDRNELTQVKHYDATNALVMTEDNKYDYFGSRIQKTVNDGVTTEVSRYALDGWNPANPSTTGTEGFNVWAKLDGSISLETRYFYNDDIDHLIARIDHVDTTAVQLWYLQDYQNSTRYVLDQTGTVVDSLRYDGYGNIDVGSELDPSMRGDYAWTGREIDVETGLQYNRARWYDGQTGRWISQDPLGFDAGDSNLYRYVNNRVTIATDPSGKQIYVITGANDPTSSSGIVPNPGNKAVHQDIAVDTWKKEGNRWVKAGRSYYTFAANGGVNFWVGPNWLGIGTSWTSSWATGEVFDVTAERKVGAGTVVSLLQTTPEEDNEFKQFLDTFVRKEDGYSVARHNCRMFSQWMFQKAEEKFPNREVIHAK